MPPNPMLGLRAECDARDRRWFVLFFRENCQEGTHAFTRNRPMRVGRYECFRPVEQ